MLPAARRLRTTREFDEVFSASQPRRGRLISVRLRADGPQKVGIIVGKRVSPRAVDRNRLKRQIRAVVTNRLPQLRGTLVIVAEPAARGANTTQLSEEFDQLAI